MVAYFYQGKTRFFRPQYTVMAPKGLPVLGVRLPPGLSNRQLEGISRRLYRRGIRRFLAGERVWIPSPLIPVDPLPLCRVRGAQLALELLSHLPLRERRAALRGEKAGPEAWAIAEQLCPQVGALLLEFDRGEEALSRHLRSRYGAAPLHLGQEPAPQVAVELSPCSPGAFRTLRLWGEPELLGLTLRPEWPLPPELPPLPFLELLWETGRIEPEELRPVREPEWP